MARRRPGSGSVERRGGSWEIRYFREDKKRARKVLGSAEEMDKAEARRRADDLLFSIRGAAFAPELTVDRLFGELEPVMRSFLGAATVRDRMLVGGLAGRFFGRRPARAIDVPAAQDFMATLAGRAPNTIRGYRARLVQVWTLAHERGLLGPSNPWRLVRVPRAVESAIEPMRRGDAELLAPFLSREEADLLRFLCETGLRCGEANRLRWEDVRDGRVHVKLSKTGRPRSCVLSGAARAVVASVRLRGTADARVFRGLLDGNGYRRTRLHLHAACEGAGLPRMNLHGARHGFACDLADAGCTERDIACALGQRDQKSAARYTAHGHPDAGGDRAIRRLEAHRAALLQKAE